MEILEIIRFAIVNIILPSVAVAMTYFGWKAGSERNKLKAELEGIKANNEGQIIKNQSSWIDLYKKLHEDQAQRIVELGTEVKELRKELHKFKKAYAKISTCAHFAVCPLRDQLQDTESNKREHRKDRNESPRQCEPP